MNPATTITSNKIEFHSNQMQAFHFKFVPYVYWTVCFTISPLTTHNLTNLGNLSVLVCFPYFFDHPNGRLQNHDIFSGTAHSGSFLQLHKNQLPSESVDCWNILFAMPQNHFLIKGYTTPLLY